MNLYKTTKWKKKRASVLRKHGYLCQESLRYGRRVTATTVHHIYPVSEHPELAFNSHNLLPLTDERHNEMHDRITGEITEKGKRWQEKIAPLVFK